MPFPKNCDLSRVSGTFGGKRPGPKTPQGKAIAARNATTHGLFARDIVLPSLGEDPAGYDALHLALCEQINPRNLLEQHYVEAIASASWRLRRLHQWQAQLYEDETLTEDERMTKLDRVLRHETTFHRQIDKAVRLLGRDVPFLFESRARKDALAELSQTERSCRADLTADQDVADRAQDNLQFQPLPSDFDRRRLDSADLTSNAIPIVIAPVQTETCQNELPAEAAPIEATVLPDLGCPETKRKQRKARRQPSARAAMLLPPKKRCRFRRQLGRTQKINPLLSAREGGRGADTQECRRHAG